MTPWYRITHLQSFSLSPGLELLNREYFWIL